MERLDAERRSYEPEVVADLERFGVGAFMSVDMTLRLHLRHKIAEPWNEWEWPRRIAAHRATRQAFGVHGP